MVGIYKITSPTGKVYIGQSRNIDKRFYQYKTLRCKDQYRIFNSLKKHGAENHSFNVICEMPSTVNQHILNYSEQFFMDSYSAMGFELMNLKGAGSHGKVSEESRKRLSEALKGVNTWTKGRKRTEEQRKLISERVKKWHHDNKRIPKIKVKKERMPFPEALKKRYSEERSGEKNLFYGKKHTEETKRIISMNNSLNRRGANNGRHRAILQYDLNGIFIKEWDTITNASNELGIKRTTISGCLNGCTKRANQYIFKYKL